MSRALNMKHISRNKTRLEERRETVLDVVSSSYWRNSKEVAPVMHDSLYLCMDPILLSSLG